MPNWNACAPAPWAHNRTAAARGRGAGRGGGVAAASRGGGGEPLGRLQKVAVEESRLGIPLLFAMDVVHGYRTIFPVPLALAATFAPDAEERAARIAAEGATAAGPHRAPAPLTGL